MINRQGVTLEVRESSTYRRSGIAVWSRDLSGCYDSIAIEVGIHVRVCVYLRSGKTCGGLTRVEIDTVG